MAALSITGTAVAFLGACQPIAPVSAPDEASSAVSHGGIETIAIDDDLVTVIVWMSGPATEADLIAYSRCAAAQYALNQGNGFARHVRTNVQVEGSVRSADAVYTVSPTLPRGLQTLDAEVTAANCAELGIPTV